MGCIGFGLYAQKRAQQSLFLPGFNAGSEAVPGAAALQSSGCLMRRREPNALNSLNFNFTQSGSH
jgi:hypothetical protein